MKRFILSAPLLAIATGSPVQALEFGDGFYVNGEVELEYFDISGGGSGDTLGYASVDLGYQQPAGGFGFFLGVDAFSLNSTSEAVAYAALSYSGGFGKLQFGVPRPAIDDYLETPRLGGLRLFELLGGRASDSVLTSAYLLSDLDAPLGLRYDGTFGDLAVGTSLHRVEDTNVLDVAVNYQMGDVELRAAVEHLWDSGSSATNLHLGAETTLGPVKAGLLYSDTEDAGGFRLGQLYAIYSPIEKLNLTGTVWHQTTPFDTGTFYGLAADYTFAQGAYVEAGLADGSGSESIYNVSLGLKF